ncbi:MAG: helix-turn-helix domain-containing protein [Propionivibrio sp.]|nr:helix-turn-helix domain-containing protein [Propionivibrio sp.]
MNWKPGSKPTPEACYAQLPLRNAARWRRFLRAGEAMDRIRRLFVILSGETAQETIPVFIPCLKDMADITGLTQETVSRVVSQLRRLGILTRQGRSHGVIVMNALKKLPLQAS